MSDKYQSVYNNKKYTKLFKSHYLDAILNKGLKEFRKAGKSYSTAYYLCYEDNDEKNELANKVVEMFEKAKLNDDEVDLNLKLFDFYHKTKNFDKLKELSQDYKIMSCTKNIRVILSN